jgi:hypothetical protein
MTDILHVYKPFQGRFRQFLTVLIFVAMIVINVLATTGASLGATGDEISDENKNALTPDNLTFTVWGSNLCILDSLCDQSTF